MQVAHVLGSLGTGGFPHQSLVLVGGDRREIVQAAHSGLGQWQWIIGGSRVGRTGKT